MDPLIIYKDDLNKLSLIFTDYSLEELYYTFEECHFDFETARSRIDSGRISTWGQVKTTKHPTQKKQQDSRAFIRKDPRNNSKTNNIEPNTKEERKPYNKKIQNDNSSTEDKPGSTSRKPFKNRNTSSTKNNEKLINAEAQTTNLDNSVKHPTEKINSFINAQVLETAITNNQEKERHKHLAPSVTSVVAEPPSPNRKTPTLTEGKDLKNLNINGRKKSKDDISSVSVENIEENKTVLLQDFVPNEYCVSTMPEKLFTKQNIKLRAIKNKKEILVSKEYIPTYFRQKDNNEIISSQSEKNSQQPHQQIFYDPYSQPIFGLKSS